MRNRLVFVWSVRLIAAVAALFVHHELAEAQRFLRRLMPVQRVSADVSADYRLTQENGPWLVMACTFSGEGGEDQARDLVLEFRERFNLPAYTHSISFDRSGDHVGRGIDEFGAPVRMRYRKGDKSQEWAVLVGDFPSIDDPDAQKLLKTVKTVRPDALDPTQRDGGTAQSLAAERAWQNQLINRLKNNKQLGPMRSAFMTRNPLLPREYFVPKGVDKFVEKLNRGLPHSLLKNGSKYTVKVATFRGASALAGAKNAPNLSDRRGKKQSALERAVDNAELLAIALNKKGYQAYSFHDREQSIVTVGGFESINAPDGSGRPSAEVLRILQTFDASANTPTDPLADPVEQAKISRKTQAAAQQRLDQFNQRFSAQHGLATPGLQPKFTLVPPGSPKARVIPFDVHPTVIEVPKKSISAGFAWRR